MNWDAAGAIGEIVGACAVLITLVYLAKQIRQSTDVSKVLVYHGHSANPPIGNGARLLVADRQESEW